MLEKKDEAANLERAVLVCEIENVDLSAAELMSADSFPAFLHVLQRAGGGEHADAWTGRIKVLKKAIRDNGNKTRTDCYSSKKRFLASKI